MFGLRHAARFLYAALFHFSLDRGEPVFVLGGFPFPRLTDCLDAKSGHDGLRALFRDVAVARRIIIAHFEKDPLIGLATSLDENPFALELLAVQDEVEFAFT